MRVVSLVPAGTEIVTAIGAADLLVGVSAACDFPAFVRGLPRVTHSTVDAALGSGEIARRVSAAAVGGQGPIALDTAMLARLRPDVLIGQGLCAVCAVGDVTVGEAARALCPPPTVVSLHAHTIAQVLADIGRVGAALRCDGAADVCIGALENRLGRLQSVGRRGPRPRVLVLEWVDPPYVAGHWVPELIELAGGEFVGSAAGERSTARPWNELVALAPDLVVIALCGFDVRRARAEVAAVDDPEARVLLSRRVEFLDGNSYTSRPGPRLVDAAETLAEMLEG